MRRFWIPALILFSSAAGYAGGGFSSLAQNQPASRYAGTCSRRCESGSRSIWDVTVLDMRTRRRSRDKAYLLSSGNPTVVCRCASEQVRHRTRADREVTVSLVNSCEANCRQGIRYFPNVTLVERDGSEHGENISVLQYESPIGCLCGNIPVTPSAPRERREHPDGDGH